jgi:hypothetical protein
MGAGAISTILGLWAVTDGWDMIASRLDRYSSKGTCCLFSASGTEESLAPKKTTNRRILAAEGEGITCGRIFKA